MNELRTTPLHDAHLTAGAKLVDFAGWEMPLQYAGGILAEHLATRKTAGLFDVSHMGRFVVRGRGAIAFLQHALTNNAAALAPGGAQYTLIPNETGGAVDDAYLYRFVKDEYLLVVNVANAQKDWDHFQSLLSNFPKVELTNVSDDIAMISLQGPRSEEILLSLLDGGNLPEPKRNALGSVSLQTTNVNVARTGYTGEPLCFELFVPSAEAPALWKALVEQDATPVGLGARDTLRLEAALPLYGHELGTDPEGKEIPIFACPLAKFAVSLSSRKGDFLGKSALAEQEEAFRKIVDRDYSSLSNLPRRIQPVAILEKAIARQGTPVHSRDGTSIGYVTSGTMVPYWKTQKESAMRPIGLAMLDSNIRENEIVQMEIRGRTVEARVVAYHFRSEAPPCARAVIYPAAP